MWILESERLGFRRLVAADYAALCEILQDAAVMYAWEHAFSDAEAHAWLAENLRRYETDGFSYFAALAKDSGTLVGVIGPLVETVAERTEIGVGYILKRDCWGMGYAVEGARACMEYAFSTLHAPRVIAEIRPENSASRRVAEKLGMCAGEIFIKRYREKDMPHLIYSRMRAQ